MAGWGSAWQGLAQQAFGATVDILSQREERKYQSQREEMARKAAEAQEKARRDWEAKMVRMRAELDREARKEEFAMRGAESSKARKFEAQQNEAQRRMTQGYYNQMAESDRARIGLQREEMAQRERLAGLAANARSSDRPTISDSQLNNIRTEFREMDPQQAYLAAVQKYGREVADAAFGGVASSRDNAATFMGGLPRNLARYFQD